MNLLTRLRELSDKQVWSDDEFILAMRVFPRLLDVVDETKALLLYELHSEGGLSPKFYALSKALQALEPET